MQQRNERAGAYSRSCMLCTYVCVRMRVFRCRLSPSEPRHFVGHALYGRRT